MPSYANRHRLDAAEAAALRIARADTQRGGGMRRKAGQIASYIKNVAQSTYDGDVTRVPCPSVQEWEELAAGRRPVLPSTTQLNLFANDAMRRLADELGGIHEAYFKVARGLLLDPSK